MEIIILTLFPRYFDGVLQTSILKRAAEQAKVRYRIIDIRDFATDKHQHADDRPYGGGAGMVMKIEPIYKALESIQALPDQRGPETKVLLTAANGQMYTQQSARQLAQSEQIKKVVIICGHYEGVDQRVADFLVDEQVRVGDYVLTGGEPAAAIITDTVVRLLPEVLGNQESLVNESHDSPGDLAHPVYTRPAIFNNWPVPDTLVSGHHKQIEEWRQSLTKKLLRKK